MTTIERIELFHVAVPLAKPFYPSWIPGYPQTENRFDLIRIVTKSGLEGWSAGPAMGRERRGFGELLAPYLIGLDATDIPLVQQRLREMSYLGLRNAWIEPAFWDVLGKHRGTPVHALLDGDASGGKRGEVRLYASTGEVKSPEARVEEVLARFEEGFDSVKIRVHDFDERADIAQVTAVMKAVSGKMKVGVDANQAWRVTAIADAPLWDLARAKRFADACADLGVSWLEEPLPMDAYDDLAALTRSSRVPIAGGELHTGGYPELRMMIDRRCYHWFQPDAMFTGGIAQTVKVIDHCKREGLKYTPHTWTNGIGFAVNLQLMAYGGDREHGRLEYPLNPPSWTTAARDAILTTPFEHDRGRLTITTAPGLGFEIDRRALRRYGTRFFSMGKLGLAVHAVMDKGIRTAREIDRNRRSNGANASRT